MWAGEPEESALNVNHSTFPWVWGVAMDKAGDIRARKLKQLARASPKETHLFPGVGVATDRARSMPVGVPS
jgi:hypothetical protein